MQEIQMEDDIELTNSYYHVRWMPQLKEKERSCVCLKKS